MRAGHRLEQTDQVAGRVKTKLAVTQPESKLGDHRQVYERTKKQHINIVAEVEKLFKTCQLEK